jgi:DNA polymerase-3 subunit alpha
MDLKILPPDVNHSGCRFKPEGDGLRYGLAGIKNVGEGAAKAIIAEREANGPFSDLVDFCSRVGTLDVNKKVMESLARCGGLDCVGMHRARIFNGVDFAIARAAEAQRDKESGQGNLFDLMMGGGDEDDAVSAELPPCEPWHESEQLAAERELLGIYMSGHPLTQYESILKKYQLATIAQIPDLEDHALTRIGGLASIVIKKVTKKKEMMAVIEFEDLEDSIEVLVWPDTFRTYAGLLENDATLLIGGEVSKKSEIPTLIAHEIYPLEDAPRHFSEALRLHISCTQLEASIMKVKDTLRLHPGTIPVVICLVFPSGEKITMSTDIGFNVLPNMALLHELEQELGENTVFVQAKQAPLKNGEPKRKPWEKRG